MSQSRNPLRQAYTRARPYLICALACVAITFVNPYTWHLHQHIFAYVRDSKLLDNIGEFQSVNFHHPGSVFFQCMLFLGLPAAFWCLSKGKFAEAISIGLWGHLALFSGRNVPLFILIAAPWAACMSLDLPCSD